MKLSLFRQNVNIEGCRRRASYPHRQTINVTFLKGLFTNCQILTFGMSNDSHYSALFPKLTYWKPKYQFHLQAKVSMWGDWGATLYCGKGVSSNFSSIINCDMSSVGQLCTLMLPGRILGLLTWPSQQSGFQDGVSRYPGSVHIVHMDCNWADKLWNTRLWSNLEIDLQRLGWRQKVVHTWILVLDVVHLRRYFFTPTWLWCILRDL